MNKKGFTLTELMAVIVILAIIAMIASPIILNIINDSRLSTFKSSVTGVKKAIEQDYGDNDFVKSTAYKYGGFDGTDYSVDNSTHKLIAHPLTGSTREVNMSGVIEGKGKGQIGGDGSIEIVIFTKRYCAILVGGGEVKTKPITSTYTAQNCVNDFDVKKGF